MTSTSETIILVKNCAMARDLRPPISSRHEAAMRKGKHDEFVWLPLRLPASQRTARHILAALAYRVMWCTVEGSVSLSPQLRFLEQRRKQHSSLSAGTLLMSAE